MTTKIDSIDPNTATAATIRAYLKSANANGGQNAAGEYTCQLRVAKLRAYAVIVMAIRATGDTDELTPITAEAKGKQIVAMAKLQAAHSGNTAITGYVAKQEAERAAKAAAAPKASKRQQANDEIAQLLLAMGTVTPDGFAAVTGKGLSVYWRPSAWITGKDGRQPAYWNAIFTACVRLGIGCEYKRVDGEATVSFRQLNVLAAQNQRDAMTDATDAYKAKLAARKAERKAQASA